MPVNQGKLTKKELKERWETDAGNAFKKEIIRQLTSNMDNNVGNYSIDWQNLSIDTGMEKFYG